MIELHAAEDRKGQWWIEDQHGDLWPAGPFATPIQAHEWLDQWKQDSAERRETVRRETEARWVRPIDHDDLYGKRADDDRRAQDV